jgi:hypothetical protein
MLGQQPEAELIARSASLVALGADPSSNINGPLLLRDSANPGDYSQESE